MWLLSWKRIRIANNLTVILNGQRMPFPRFLQDFRRDVHPPLSSQLYHLWIRMPEEMLQELCAHYTPPNLREAAIAKWRSFNTFRFLDLPQEIRGKIITKALYWPNSGIVEAFKVASCFPDRQRNLALITTCKQVYQGM